jgi:hypothetical protein
VFAWPEGYELVIDVSIGCARRDKAPLARFIG